MTFSPSRGCGSAAVSWMVHTAEPCVLNSPPGVTLGDSILFAKVPVGFDDDPLLFRLFLRFVLCVLPCLRNAYLNLVAVVGLDE